MPGVEIFTRARLIGVVAVYGHIAAVLVVHAVSLAGRPDEAWNAVALANINEQVDQSGVGFGIDRVRVFGIAGDLNRDRAVIICGIGGAPGAVLLLAVHTDTAVCADTVVAGRLSGGRCKDIAQGLHRALADHAMDSHGVDLVISGACPVRRDFRIRDKFTVAQLQHLPCHLGLQRT